MFSFLVLIERGKARTGDLVRFLEEIEGRETEVGGAAVALGWVKSHIGIKRNDKADEMAKAEATIRIQGPSAEGNGGGVQAENQGVEEGGKAGEWIWEGEV